MTAPTPVRYAANVTRAAWPDPLFDADLALVLGLPGPEAAAPFVHEHGMRYLLIGGRLAVRASALAEWLAAREIHAPRRAPDAGRPT